MGSYLLRRLTLFIPMLFGITIITFLVANLAPGDPISALISPDDQLREDDLERMRKALGLDKPIPVRYVIWVKELVTGNFGFSYFTKQPVMDRVGPSPAAHHRAHRSRPRPIAVDGTGVRGNFCASPLQFLGLRVKHCVTDRPLHTHVLLRPRRVTFVWASLASIAGVRNVQRRGNTLPGKIIDNLEHIILPALILSIDLVATNTRYARTAMLEVLAADYVRTARSKGLSNWVVFLRHGLRNALLPIITITSLRLPLLLGGAIVIEIVFSWPGLGQLSVDAIHQRDYPVLMALTLFLSTMVLASNLVADVLYAYADPRIRYGEGG